MSLTRSKDKFSWRIRFKIEKILKRILGDAFPKNKKVNALASYSEAQQDLFVLKMTQAKTQGTYVEIGSGHPERSNNTYLLESKYGWRGVSVELSARLAHEFRNARVNPVINSNATEIDYSALFEEYNLPNEIDFLQIDIDPALQSLQTLQRIPFEKYKFSVITFEHDSYRATRRIAKDSRRLLRSFGYTLAVKNVRIQKLKPFEDWWIHTDLIENHIWMELQTFRKKQLHLKRHHLNAKV
jgi:hypothetical protein